MFRSPNVAARVFQRQILAPRPGASINFVRQFYENLVPGCTVCDVDCPDHSFRRFTDDGQYIVSFSRNTEDIIVFRPKWLSYSFKGEDCNHQILTQKAKKFDSFFTHLYSISLGSSNESICKEFFLYLENHQFGLFATKSHELSSIDGTLLEFPAIEKITLHLVRLNDGVVMDEKSFHNDYVNLTHSMGVFLYENLLCVLSLRYQTIHILQVREPGNLVDVRSIGPFCLEDDELFLNSHSQCSEVVNKSRSGESVHLSTNNIHHQQVTQANSFLSGIKQRLLSFIFRKAWNEEPDPSLRGELLKKFYYHFQDFLDLHMLKQVQFLDHQHLLLKFGSIVGGVLMAAQHLAFFAVYDMETTKIVAFYQNSSEELYSLFERFYDYFHAKSRDPLHANFISSHSNNIYALEQLQTMKSKASSRSQYVKMMLGSLPYTCQSQTPSPYFDLSLFRYDEKSSSDRELQFISRRQPNVPKFKIKTGVDSSSADGRAHQSSFIFHPYLPLVLSIQRAYGQPTVVNIHVRL